MALCAQLKGRMSNSYLSPPTSFAPLSRALDSAPGRLPCVAAIARSTSIRDAAVSQSEVKAIAGVFESVRWCEVTGEVMTSICRHITGATSTWLVPALTTAAIARAELDYVAGLRSVRAQRLTGREPDP